MKAKGVFDLFSKKERAMKEKDVKRLAKSLQGIKDMTELPGCLFIIDPSNEVTAIQEGRRIGIPIVAVCDTNTDPDMIDYPIPGNDDAIRAIRLITSIIADAVIQGRQQAKDAQDLAAATEAAAAASADEAMAAASKEGEPLSA
jgi:small subunit ribosomal protein S2